MQIARTHNHAKGSENNEHGQSLEQSILKILCYFDIFRYPLTQNEIRQFLDQPVITAALQITLEKLAREQRVFRLDEYYSLRDEMELVDYRRQGNQRAIGLLKKGIKIARFLQRFPFVRAVSISGSLSKNFADKKADIDFFIITETNRVWVARSFMHIYKKFTYLLGRQNYYCMNYYIDSSSLTIGDKNIYTAIEVKTLLPVTGKTVMDEFFRKNDWSNEFLPVCINRSLDKDYNNTGIIKRSIEKLLEGRLGEAMDNWLWKFTSQRWKKKELRGKLNKKGMPMGLITGKNFARTNPDSFQEKLLALYDSRISLLLKSDNVIIPDNTPGPF